MIFALRLIRRLGLAAGVLVLLHGVPSTYANPEMAIGAAIVAFFLPGIGPVGEKGDGPAVK